MRIRNLRPFAVYMAYAGLKNKGWNVPAGKRSPEVPIERFRDPQLQKDWRSGYIDLELSATDEALLGADVAKLVRQKPAQPAPKPAATSKVAEATSEVAEATSEVAEASVSVTTESPGHTEQVVAPQASDAQSAVWEPVLPAAAPVVAASEEQPVCVNCGKLANVEPEPKAGNMLLCRFCRSVLNRKDREVEIPPNPASVQTADESPHQLPTPAARAQQLAGKGVDPALAAVRVPVAPEPAGARIRSERADVQAQMAQRAIQIANRVAGHKPSISEREAFTGIPTLRAKSSIRLPPVKGPAPGVPGFAPTRKLDPTAGIRAFLGGPMAAAEALKGGGA